MAVEAERLLKGIGWLPEVLRRADLVALEGAAEAEGQGTDVEVAAELAADIDHALDGIDLPAFLGADLSSDPAQMIAAE